MVSAPQKQLARDELFRCIRNSAGIEFSTLSTREQSIAVSKFYIREIRNKLKTEITDEDLEDSIVDGRDDLGCDLIYRDDNRVLIIQTKYRKSSHKEDAKDIIYFQDIFSRLKDPNLKPNRKLSSILSEIDWRNDTFEMIFITFGRMERNSQARIISNSLVKYPKNYDDLVDRVSWEYLDETDLNIQLRSANSFQREIPDKAIKLFPEGKKGQKGESAVIQIQSKDYNSYVMILDVMQLIQAYEELGRDSLFSLNIRNYIGSTSTNKRIITTAENEADNFFIYNNGISCLATRIQVNAEYISVSGLQVINGAQTVKALYHIYSEKKRTDMDRWASSKPKVLVRITELPAGYGSTGKVREQITRYNNTQNVVKISDFRSNDPIHFDLKKSFNECYRNNRKVTYVAKRTDKLGSNEIVKMEEFAKCVYAFLYNFIDFSGSSSFLFNDDPSGGYCKVFGDGCSTYEQMDQDEFRLRAGIYWIAQEIASDIKATRSNEADPDDRAALERKWCLLFGFRIAIMKMYPNDQWKIEIRKLYKGDWSMSDNGKGQLVRKIYNHSRAGVKLAYKTAKDNNEDFVHRNWMRSKKTLGQIENAVKALVDAQR